MPVMLSQLFPVSESFSDVLIAGVTADSRKVGPGFMFAALQGVDMDGRDYIADALEKGAVVILSDHQASLPAGTDDRIAILCVENPRKIYGEICARFFHDRPGYLAGVTGTNGKTSVADFTRQIWKALGLNAASMGTLGVRADLMNSAGGLTTPDPEILHKNLQLMSNAGVTHCALEASSHGLDQYRLDGVTLQAAAFTNLSRDHLDYHKNQDSYFKAKARLFTDYLASDGIAAINIDTIWGVRLVSILQGYNKESLTVGHHIDADVCIIATIPRPSGLEVYVKVKEKRLKLHIPLMGVFQADNAILAAALASTLASTVADTQVASVDADLIDCLKAVETLKGVSGRMQSLGLTEKGGHVYVDFAHTPDGLETVLHAARAHTTKQLSVVFGCGGNRDKGKRPMMGQIACKIADKVIVTDDNPRREDAAVIRSEILAACDAQAIEIADRYKAIETAISSLGQGDILVLAGKGHEEGQIVGDEVLPFSDIRTANKFLKKQALKPGLASELFGGR